MPIIEDITNAIKIQIKSLMPVNLDKECDKAAKTLQEFVFDSNLQVKVKYYIKEIDTCFFFFFFFWKKKKK